MHKYWYEEDSVFASSTDCWLSNEYIAGHNPLTVSPLTSVFFPSSSLSGSAGRFIHKWKGSDAVYQHRRRLLFPATVHLLHPGHTHLPPQGRRQAPGLLQGGQGGYHSRNMKRKGWFCSWKSEREDSSDVTPARHLCCQHSNALNFNFHTHQQNLRENLMCDLPFNNTAVGQIFLCKWNTQNSDHSHTHVRSY